VDLLRQTRDGLTDGMGRPVGDDFINFWSGPFLAWHQRSAEIYNFGAFQLSSKASSAPASWVIITATRRRFWC
jgi:hypothetical protein